MNPPTVTDNPVAERFEAHIDGRLAGFADYQLTDALIVFTHTEVDPAFEGQGVGSAIARFALDQLLEDDTRSGCRLPGVGQGRSVRWLSRLPGLRRLGRPQCE